MKSELVVDVQTSEITTAFVEDGRLVEINREPRDMNWSVGNIYYGRVKKIMPALNAAFVDIGHEKEAFLHYFDLGSQFNDLYNYTQQVVSNRKRLVQFPTSSVAPIIGKLGTIEDVLEVGQNVLVQIAKEPINTKGPRLTAEISIAGRYLVLIPFQDKVMVSGKIKSEKEKKRLRSLVASIKPKGYGVIIRTVAADVQLNELQREMNILYKRWEDAIFKLQKSEPVSLISPEIGRTIGIIRDVFNSSFDHIYVNDSEMYSEIIDYVELIAPDCKQIVKQYSGIQPIFDHFDITRQTKVGLGRTVSFKNGGYLVMEKTEALFVIDVNSGTRKVGDDQEQNALNVNLAAADEIAHQLRLRDIGGIIVVDFIDMSNADHRQQLYEYMRKLMVRDRAKHNVLPLSKFGLMQITRQRVRPAVEIDINEVCPTCRGKGKVQSSFLFSDHLENIIPQMAAKYGRGMTLFVHPYVYAYLSKGWICSTKLHWRFRYGLRLLQNQSLGFLEYHFLDKQGNHVEEETVPPTPKKLVFEDEKNSTKQTPKQPKVEVQQAKAKTVAEQPKAKDKVVEQPKVKEKVVEQPKAKDNSANAKSEVENQMKIEEKATPTSKKSKLLNQSVEKVQPKVEIVEVEKGLPEEQIVAQPIVESEEKEKKSDSKSRKSKRKSKKESPEIVGDESQTPTAGEQTPETAEVKKKSRKKAKKAEPTPQGATEVVDSESQPTEEPEKKKKTARKKSTSKKSKKSSEENNVE